ncbi:DUF4153 domain-containing protein [Rhodococcus koreensis]
MSLYERQYGYTRLRVTVLWLGVVFVLLVGAIDPDAYVARKNVERFEDTGRIDVSYLGSLAVDAVSALDRLPEPEPVLRPVRTRPGGHGRLEVARVQRGPQSREAAAGRASGRLV